MPAIPAGCSPFGFPAAAGRYPAGVGSLCKQQFIFELFADLAWENFSPSRLLLEGMIRWCIENGVEEFDFLPRVQGGSMYKDLWADSTVSSTSFAIPLSLRGLLLLRWRRSAIVKWIAQSIARSPASRLAPAGVRRALRPVAAHKLQQVAAMAPADEYAWRRSI
jgi:CelD/BcsL family acetyltransferase involved in cellulose biosynthesis